MKTHRILVHLCFIVLFSLGAYSREAGDFDHFKTGFPLEGLHKFVSCSDCHQSGRFKGTPTQCQSCHADRGKISAGTKHLAHINSTDRCDSCHITQGWGIVMRVDHSEVRGVCNTCHNGIIATGTSIGHPETGATPCNSCHSTNFWYP